MRCPAHRRVALAVLSTLVATAADSARAQAPCPDWATYDVPGISGQVYATAVFDDGTGPALYVGGSFDQAGGRPARSLARWNGTEWSAVDSDLVSVRTLLVHDDGSGTQLYAGGNNTLQRWDGQSWTDILGTLFGYRHVYALAAFDDGTGMALYAAGSFELSGTGCVARWNGTQWNPVGAGLAPLQPGVKALAVFDDGTGPHLYAGGDIGASGATQLAHLARWSGAAWEPVSNGTNFPIHALATFDDGTGTKLYLGGSFTIASGVNAEHVASFDGTQFAALGSGVTGPVFALRSMTLAGAPALYAGGLVAPPGSNLSPLLSRWDGVQWSTQGLGGFGYLLHLGAYDDGSGPELVVCGSFSQAGNVSLSGIARWDGADWSGYGTGDGMDAPVHVLATSTVDGPSALYAGGEFAHAGPAPANHVARFDGTGWTPLGAGVDHYVFALCEHDDGPGPALYAGGRFTNAGGAPAAGIARWNGTSWSAVGNGLDGWVYALASWDDGTGEQLYAGGSFTHSGGVSTPYVARWDGTSWSTLANGMNWDVHAFRVFDSGGGPALHAGGIFTVAGGLSCKGIARWDGTSWSPLGSGVDGQFLASLQVYVGVLALDVHDDGTGPALIAGGFFQTAGGASANSIARWNGTSWSALSGSLGTGLGLQVHALRSHDDGDGRALYVGSGWYSGSGNLNGNLRRWRGGVFAPLPTSGTSGGPYLPVRALAAWDDGRGGPDLYLGGQFTGAGPGWSRRFAAWRGCDDPGVAFCFGDGSATACPCGNTGATGHGCANSANAAGALLAASGAASLANDTIVLDGTGMPATAPALFLQGAESDAGGAGTAIFDGVRCIGGAIVRLGTKFCAAGAAHYPEPGNPSVSVRGQVPAAGATRTYQIYYRNAAAAFCPPEGANWSNGFRTTWYP